MTNLTIDILKQAIELLRPPLYYALDNNIEKDQMFVVKQSGLYPEFIVCHPEDFETLKTMFPEIRFVDLKDSPANLGTLI